MSIMARVKKRWSHGEAPFLPPPCAWLKLINFSSLLSMRASTIVPMDDDVVMIYDVNNGVSNVKVDGEKSLGDKTSICLMHPMVVI